MIKLFVRNPLGVTVLLAAVALACSGGGGGGSGDMTGPPSSPDPNPPPTQPPSPSPPPGGTTVEVRTVNNTLRFDPAERTISVGTTVRWVNQGGLFHTVTPDGHSEWQERGRTTAGTILEHTFQSAGEFRYYCDPHRPDGMTGVITVQ